MTILYSGLGDLRLAAALHQELNALLTDTGSLWKHPALTYFGDQAGKGSTVLEVPLAGLDGYDKMAAVAEGSATSNTSLTDASPSITIARQAIQRQISDLAQLTDSVGLGANRLAQSMVGEAAKRFTEMVVTTTDDFPTTVGSTGVDMSVDDFFDAQFALTQASVAGPYVCVLYPVQLTDLQNSIRAEAGAIQFIAATQDMLRIKGPGYVGSFNGIDIYTSSLVPTANAGADSAGGMFGAGAVGWADATVNNLPGVNASIMPAGSKIFVEFERDAAYSYTKIVGNYYCGVSILQDSMGVSIITDR